MPSLPPAMVPLLMPFASLFDVHTWRKVPILLAGVILAPGRRTVSTALYVLGLQARGDFALFHPVLSRASWSPLAVSRGLPDSWSATWSRRDRSGSLSMRPWSGTGARRSRPWGCTGTRCARPAATSSKPRGCALDAVLHAPPRRPGQIGRPRVVGARRPSLKAVLADPATVWTDLTQRGPDGISSSPPAPPSGTARASPPWPCAGCSCATQADAAPPQVLLGTRPDRAPRTLLAWYLQRWQAEVTFQEIRSHLGVETQRQ